MCGIAGFQGAFSPELLARMSRAVAHRGPDGDGCALLGRDAHVPVGLAHRRLAIIDLSADGRQPMPARCPRCRSTSLDDLALIYNGELYEYRALRARGRQFGRAKARDHLGGVERFAGDVGHRKLAWQRRHSGRFWHGSGRPAAIGTVATSKPQEPASHGNVGGRANRVE